jgi:hypothetical protein
MQKSFLGIVISLFSAADNGYDPQVRSGQLPAQGELLLYIWLLH